MSYEIFKRQDHVKRDDRPKVSFRKDTVAFNSELTKKAKLSDFNKVTIYVDAEAYKVGFKFHNDDSDKNALALYSDGQSKSNRVISARQLYKSNKWLMAISRLPDRLDRHFEATWNNIEGLWTIITSPSFEDKVSSESELNNLKGIYRYLSDGEVVYIGRGDILSRLNSPDRSGWDFDVIEYSVIESLEEQKKWESFWINKHVEQFGKLPRYNKLQVSQGG